VDEFVLQRSTAVRDEGDATSPDAGRTLALHSTGFRGLAEPRFNG